MYLMSNLLRRLALSREYGPKLDDLVAFFFFLTHVFCDHAETRFDRVPKPFRCEIVPRMKGLAECLMHTE